MMDLRADLGRVTALTLAMAGNQDPAIPAEHTRAIAERMQHCRVEFIEGAAHLATYEQADEVTALILKHLLDQKG